MPETNNKKDQLAYVLITPYSLHKSRTGGIIARLLWADIHLSAVRMYAPKPDSDFLEKYCDALYDPEEKNTPLEYQRLLIQYVMENLGNPNVKGVSNRMMLLIFRGPNALEDINNAVGHIGRDVRGDDVRGTFGDYLVTPSDTEAVKKSNKRVDYALARYPALQNIEWPEKRASFFEPAVLTGRFPGVTAAHMQLFRDHAYSDGGYVLSALDERNDQEMETSMVILKPESFRRRNPLPGNLVDFFSRLGLFITGAKMVRLSVDQAKEFYSAKMPQFRKQLKGMVADKAGEVLSKAELLREKTAEICNVNADDIGAEKALRLAQRAEYVFSPPHESGPGEVKKEVIDSIYSYMIRNLGDLEPPQDFFDTLAEELKEINARAEFNELIRYMSGADPHTGSWLAGAENHQCMALLYSGPDSLGSIRRRLKELRDVYGQNILYNRAHASDPDEDPVLETEILGMPNAPGGEEKPCDVEKLINQFY